MAAHNRRAFPVFASEMPFVLPQPIPEPPRVINPRPMVPDLSIDTPTANGHQYHAQYQHMSSPHHRQQQPSQQQYYHNDYRDMTDKWRTIYPMATQYRPQSPPKPSSPYPTTNGAHDLPYRSAATGMTRPQVSPLNNNFAANRTERRALATNTGVGVDNNGVNYGRKQAFVDHTNDMNVVSDNKNPKNVFTNGRQLVDNRPAIDIRNTGKPTIVRHSQRSPPVEQPVIDRASGRQRLPNGPTVPKTTEGYPQQPSKNGRQNDVQISPTNDQMMDIIRQQDIQLQRISQQIQELLSFHRISDSKTDDISKRSVQTMTSLVIGNENTENTTPVTHRTTGRNRLTFKGVNSPKSATPSTTTKDLRALRLNTISEGVSEPSDIDIDSYRLNYSDSPVRRRRSDNSSSIEEIRRDHNSGDISYDNQFYGRVLNDIHVMLKNDSTIDTDDEESGRRSSCSPTPPHSRRRSPPTRHHQRIEIQSEQTLYIKRLAAKYLVNDSEPKTRTNRPKSSRGMADDQQQQQRPTNCLDVYGMTKNASIATKNYLEKYGLTYSPPRVVHNDRNNAAVGGNHHHKSGRHKQQLFNRQKILDVEALRNQTKLT